MRAFEDTEDAKTGCVGQRAFESDDPDERSHRVRQKRARLAAG